MTVKLLTEHYLEFLSLKGAAQARMSLHLLKCHIVGNHMSWLIIRTACITAQNRRLSGGVSDLKHKNKTKNSGISSWYKLCGTFLRCPV